VALASGRRIEPLVALPDFDECALGVLGSQHLHCAVNSFLKPTGLQIRAAVDVLVVIEEVAAVARHQRFDRGGQLRLDKNDSKKKVAKKGSRLASCGAVPVFSNYAKGGLLSGTR
jgi:hypothetical protein